MKKGLILLTATLIIGGVWLTGCTSNEPPVIDSLTADTLVTQGKMVAITCTATDADEDDLIYIWEATGGDFEDPTDESEIVWEAPYEAGSFTITCNVTDDEEEDQVSSSITITVAADYFPRDIGYKWFYLDDFINGLGNDDTLHFDAEIVGVETVDED
ncbi:hypothetical protein GF359_08010, partial [candidate division WOR-3 bacterium]|nr:hypothetical protein [candidate division WOR-3 bacterium]MBD3365145.1 hypothetical protein [candidate division WOR-3 bacterium]